MNWIRLIWLFIFFCNATLIAQSTPEQINGILDQQIGQSEVVSYQFQKYLISHAPQLPRPGSAKEWTTQIGEIRERLLANVIFRGWPKAWVDSSPKFEDVGLLPSGKGYTRRKLRYEVVPGMWSAAILYQPENLQGPAPAILNVTGHVGAQGKSI